MNAFDTVDTYLLTNHRIGLEEVLCDGCLLGRMSVVLDGVATIRPRLLHSETDDDGGAAFTYEGMFDVTGVRYRFRCRVFVDHGGHHFLSDIAEFEAVEWQARLAVG